MNRVLFKDIEPLIEENEISIYLNDAVLLDIASKLNYSMSDFAILMEEDFGFYIEPDTWVDLVGLAVFIDDVGLDSNTYFDKFEVVGISITDSEDGTGSNIGLTLA